MDLGCAGPPAKIEYCRDHPVLLRLGESVVERKPQQLFTGVFREGATARIPAPLTPHWRGVKRYVVKHRMDRLPPKMRNERIAIAQRRKKNVEHVVRLFAMKGDERQSHAVFLRPFAKTVAVPVPSLPAFLGNSLPVLKLGAEKRRENIRWWIAGTEVDPGVLVNDASQEPAAIGALVANDLRPFHQFRIVDEKGTALSAGKVLGFVKALGCKATERSQRLTFIPAEEPMRVILDDPDASIRRDAEDLVHLASDTGVVYRDDGLGAIRNQVLQ